MSLPKLPVGQVLRLRGLRGPWRHLGYGWVTLAKDKDWQLYVPLVEAWNKYDEEATRIWNIPNVLSDLRKSSEGLDAYMHADRIRKQLRDFNAWYDPRCFSSDFFVITLLKE